MTKKVLLALYDVVSRIVIITVVLGGGYVALICLGSKETCQLYLRYFIVGAVVIAVLFTTLFFYLGKKRSDRKIKLISLVEENGLEGEVNNFIQSFGHRRAKKGDWQFREYSFDWMRLNDFRDILNEKGMNISYKDFSDLSTILTYYIQNHETMVTRGRIKPATGSFDKMSGKDFEDLLYRLFTSMDYVVDKIGGVGDQGGDLVATNSNGQRILIQAKRYSNNVGNEAVQQVSAAKNYHNCNRAMVVTSSGFTKEAIDLAKATGVELIDGGQLRSWLENFLKESWS